MSNQYTSDMPRSAAQQRFVFVRHGATDWNDKRLFQGRSDIALNAKGYRQAEVAGRTLIATNASKIVTSPLIRAVETAKTIADALGLPIETDNELIECDFGSIEGTSIDAFCRSKQITRLQDLPQHLPSDAEPWSSVRARSQSLLQKHLSCPSNGVPILIGHDAVLQAISEQLTGCWFASRHAEPYEFRLIDHDRWEISTLA